MNWRDGLRLLPGHMHEGVERWIENGIEGGSFLNAVMANDFEGMAQAADSYNMAALQRWAQFLYSYAPVGCHGSGQKMRQWRKLGGLKGMALIEEKPNE